MKIFGKEINKSELLKRIGDITQMGGIKYYEFIDGRSKGLRAIDLKTPSGVDMTVLLDRGMDISSFFYKSIPICWRSATKETNPAYYYSRGDEWLRSFFGGLVTTCGLSNFGEPCVDNNEELSLHGRISNLCAENIVADGEWEDDTYIMFVQGKIREAKVFGPKLMLHRKIKTWIDNPKIVIEDSVENFGYEEYPFMILYHINIGYPLLDNSTVLLEPRAKVLPIGEDSKKGINCFYEFTDPIEMFKEQVFTHEILGDNDGNVNIALVNTNFNNGEGLGIWIKFNKENLPYLHQWKQMGFGEYVVGLEPANSPMFDRKTLRDNNKLKFIRPGEKINFKLEFNILHSNKCIEEFKKIYCK